MADPFEIAAARPNEWPAAFALALQQVPDDERSTRVANALTLLGGGEIDPAGIFVARTSHGLAGVQVCIPLRGSSGLFWLPQVEPSWRDADLADQLVRAALTWLRARGAKLAQALVHPAELAHTVALTRCGFQHITGLQYLRHDLNLIPSAPPSPDFRLQHCSADNERAFQHTLLRTYEGTLDCPELNGVRTIEEIIDGHRAQGIWRPETWWLASVDGAPAGVVMLTELADGDGWDLSYVGVVPEFRGRGLGQSLALHAMAAAKNRNALQLLVAVDQRNTPARHLYESLGFEPTECRQVFLMVFE